MISLFILQLALAQPPAVYSNSATQTHSIDGISIRFPQSYEEARKEFQSISRFLGESRADVAVASYQISNEVDADLSMDHLYLPSSTGKLFILSSGIHGPEGYAGHSIQMLFLRQYLRDPSQFPFGILVIHSLNPYGFKYLRRVNPANVDLNRNFLKAGEKPPNKEFEALQWTLFPAEKADTSFLSRVGFYLKILSVFVSEGKKAILGAIRGQYSAPKNVYFGGYELQPEAVAVNELIAGIIKDYDSIYHVDLHTGFGEKGKLHLFGSDEFKSPEQLELMKKIFGERSIDTSDKEDFYTTTGDFIDWTWTAYPDKRIIPMVYEFGTMDSQTILGGLKSLWISSIENQGFQNGYKTDEDRRRTQKYFEELFNPQDNHWQRQVLDQAHETLSETLQRFARTNFESDK